MKLIYICSPFRGDTDENTRAAQQYCRNAFDQNCIPVAPHLYLPQFLNDDEPRERDLALRIGLRLIDYCSEVWVHGDRISTGMRGEIEYATATGKKVVYLPGLKKNHDKDDPRYWSELRKEVERTIEEYQREEAEKGPIESIVDEEAAIDDLY